MPDFTAETAVSKMKIAVLSGKGGTGKTLVSVNLAAVAGHSTYIDCDVEEPNGHLFFKPDIAREELISVKIPLYQWFARRFMRIGLFSITTVVLSGRSVRLNRTRAPSSS
jgi:Mrp family chromosome partitioning ATPase